MRKLKIKNEKIRIKNSAAILLIAILGLFTSCNHKELCYIHPHSTRLKLVYDWAEAPEATVAGMCCFFYSLDSEGRYHRFDIPGAKEGTIELPVGKYKLVTYNNDTEATGFADSHTFDAHLATTRIGDILEPMYGNGVTSSVRGTDDEPVMITPDELFGCSSLEIEVKEYGSVTVHQTGSRADAATVSVDTEGNQTITLRPHDMLCHYSFEVRNVKQAKHISRISAALSGMSGSLYLAGENLHTQPVTLPVPAEPDVANQKVVGQFLTFGHHESNADPHRMTFYVVMDDGAKYSFSAADNLDVTTQVHNAPNRRWVHIIIDGLDLPQPIENGHGFRPEVEDWGVVEEDLKV